MTLWGFVDGEYKDLHAEIELLRGYRDEAEAEAAIASLAADRLRITEEESKAVQRAIDALNGLQDLCPTATAADAMAAYKMQRLLERHKRTPPTPTTPSEGSVPNEGTSEPQATLTNAEREAMEVAVEYVGSAFQVEHHAATLRGLLKRLGQK